ncbi:MAG: hypothetical protein JWN38_264 [Candidatus Saccharibacteria bacterium]|nr:hypothetical protein [Candidatus Saccharibacteria bacterium]
MPDRFLDNLHADPSIASCSVLASQVFAEIDQQLSAADTQLADVVVVNETNRVPREASKVRVLGITATQGFDVRVAEFRDARSGRTDQGLYSLFRGNVLLEVATLGTTAIGPCNYVQFPGEIGENMVLTPYDEQRRKPLLNEILGLKDQRPAPVVQTHEKGFGYDLDIYAPEAVRLISEYALCPAEDLWDAGKKLLAAFADQDGLDNHTAAAAAYATMLGRFDNGPLVHIYNATRQTVHRNVYRDILNHIKADPMSKYEEAMGVVGLKLGEYYRSLHGLPVLEQPATTLKAPMLEDLIGSQFTKTFGIEYSATHEKIMKMVFEVGSATVKKTVEKGYVSPDGTVSADVEYSLSLQSEGTDERYLQLFAQIVSMRDLAPTPCGLFKATKFGSLQAIKSNGDLTELVPAQIAELEDILLGDVTEATSAPTALTRQKTNKASRWHR